MVHNGIACQVDMRRDGSVSRRQKRVKSTELITTRNDAPVYCNIRRAPVLPSIALAHAGGILISARTIEEIMYFLLVRRIADRSGIRLKDDQQL